MAMRGGRFWISVLALLLAGAVGYAVNVEAACTITIMNETGYHLDSVKYVRVNGEAKVLVGQTDLPQGGSYPFHLTTPGDHVVYISFQRNGKTVYAKGTVYNIWDGRRAVLTLKQVVFTEEGKGITEVSRVEFDGLK